ncbi:MAG: Holliday junction resolvase RuvX [Rhabdochlamydiaceae bacterium]
MGRIVGLDFGSVRIGVAVSDERHILARALGVLINKPDFLQKLIELLKKEGTIDKIVVGLPLKMSGQDSAMTEAARKFAKDLEENIKLRVELWDERLTSALIERSLTDAGVRRKDRAQMSDTLSAVIILQSYLDQKDFL